MPQGNRYVVRHTDGTRSGPISSPGLKDMARNGILTSDDLVQREGSTDWVPARKVKGLHEFLEGDVAGAQTGESGDPRGIYGLEDPQAANVGFGAGPYHQVMQATMSLSSGPLRHAAYIRRIRKHTIYPTLRLYLKVLHVLFIISTAIVTIYIAANGSLDDEGYHYGKMLLYILLLSPAWAGLLLVYSAGIQWFVMIIDYAESRIEAVSRGMF